MESVIKESTNLYYEIDDCITELLKARLDKNTNKEHETICRMESLLVETMQHLSWLVGELKGNSQIKWHTGEPKESGLYIVSVSNKIGEKGITVLNWDNKDRKFLLIGLYPDLTVYAWCKLSDIEPYKEETK